VQRVAVDGFGCLVWSSRLQHLQPATARNGGHSNSTRTQTQVLGKSDRISCRHRKSGARMRRQPLMAFQQHVAAFVVHRAFAGNLSRAGNHGGLR
jgi:hypothetical protein